MKRYTTDIKKFLGLTALTATMLSGCNDDVLYDGPLNEDMARGVVIYVPSTEGSVSNVAATRSETMLTGLDDDEKNVHKLRVFAYSADGNNPDVTYELDSSNKLESSSVAGYDGYTFPLPDGKYTFYVTANVTFKDNEIQRDASKTLIAESNLEQYKVTPPANEGALENDGLPMACHNSEMSVSYGSGYTSVTSAGVTVTSGQTVKVQAPLTFSVAKVRVTLLNDMLEKTVSSSVISGVQKERDALTSTLFKDATPASYGDADFFSKGYYSLGSIKVPGKVEDLLNIQIDGLGTSVSVPTDRSKWIWQATAYVGEHLFTAAASTNPKATLKFSAGEDAVVDLGSTETGGLKRSYFYDYVGGPALKFQLDVKRWTPETIMGALHGEYFLHVNETDIDLIKAGEPYAIWYDSNAPLTFEPAKMDDGRNLYSYKVDGDSIFVSIHSRIKVEDQTNLPADKSFVIKAGTIEKRINVKDLELKEFLTVDENSVTVDVREQLASGNYTGKLNVPIRTNLSSFTIETEETSWSAANVPAGALKVIDGTGKAIDLNTKAATISVPDSGEVMLQVEFAKLNSTGATEFWNTDSYMQFNVKYTANGEAGDDGVTIHVAPSVDDYTIHLHCPGWSNPHIFVYQVLKLPSTHPSHPNAPISDGDQNAAFEYSFTGGLAFRGWGVKGTDENGNNEKNYNNPSDPLTTDGYDFYKFNGGDSEGWWNPSHGNNLKRHYYFVDFYKNYRGSTGCGTCDGNDYPKGWPGIKMTPEGNNWWKITLTGVAKAGQALIIFTNVNPDDHGNGWAQYPDKDDNNKNLPGLPLFDFPNKVGYIDLNEGNRAQFTNEKPIDTFYGIRGNIWTGSWNGDGTVKKFNYKGNGIWEMKDVTVKSGEFGIRGSSNANLTDEPEWYTSPTSAKVSNGTYDCSKSGNRGNFTIDAGTYTFTFDANTAKLTVSGDGSGEETTGYKYGIRGNIWPGYSDWYTMMMTDPDNDGIWVLNDVTVNEGSFGIGGFEKNESNPTNNHQTWINPANGSTAGNAAGKVTNQGEGNNWKIEAGTYSFSFNETTNVLTITGSGSTPTPSGDKVRLYIYDTAEWGDLNIWPGSGSDVAMNKDSSSGVPLYYYDVPKNTKVWVKRRNSSDQKDFTISSETYSNTTNGNIGDIIPTKAANSKRVYFKNTDNWITVTAYAWKDGGQTESDWTDNIEATQLIGSRYWYYDVKNDYDRIIFRNKNNHNEQTSDITVVDGALYDADTTKLN